MAGRTITGSHGKSKEGGPTARGSFAASEIMSSLYIKSSATRYKYLKYAGAQVVEWQSAATTK